MTAPLWVCPVCGQSFASPNLPHSCTVVALDDHFAASAPEVRAAFDATCTGSAWRGRRTWGRTCERHIADPDSPVERV